MSERQRLINRHRNYRNYYRSFTPNDGTAPYIPDWALSRTGGVDYSVNVFTPGSYFSRGYFGPTATVTAKVPAVGVHHHKRSGAPRWRAYETPHDCCLGNKLAPNKPIPVGHIINMFPKTIHNGFNQPKLTDGTANYSGTAYLGEQRFDSN